ncbi:hypothetical protein NH26_01790 [Flammeovirga pacifica]|uniref:YdhG-like domain-containing protein n=2 Tax=Flammeovirga pacifica TaxID=915059 RepID=A0A1S1YVV3_FLAPC|nr:hypothetical protein NH26_01790 [Flammeovirga pacifica]
MNDKEHFYLQQKEPNKSCYLALRSIIIDANPKIEETIKYSMPCFCIEKKPLCYLWKDKKTEEPYILFVDGKLLQHHKLESGTRKKMKVLPINPNQDLDLVLIQDILKMAIDLKINY